jgi:hypothetical protein
MMRQTSTHSALRHLAQSTFQRVVCTAWLAAGLGAIGCVSVEGEFPEVELTRHNLKVDGVPSISDEPVAHTVTFDHPYNALELPADIDSELRPVRCVLTARDGVEDLDFIEGFNLVIGGADSVGLPPAEIFDYQRDEPEPDRSVVATDAVDRPNVLGYWATGTTQYTLTFYGRLPEQDWSLDVSVVFEGKARFQM